MPTETEQCQQQQDLHDTAKEAVLEASHKLADVQSDYEDKWVEKVDKYLTKAEEKLDKLLECKDDPSPLICTNKVIEDIIDYLAEADAGEEDEDLVKGEMAIEKAQQALDDAYDELSDAAAAHNECVAHWSAKPWLLE